MTSMPDSTALRILGRTPLEMRSSDNEITEGLNRQVNLMNMLAARLHDQRI